MHPQQVCRLYNREKWLIRQLDVLLSRGISPSWVLTGVVGSSAQGAAKSCTHGGLDSRHPPVGLEAEEKKSSFSEKHLHILVDKKLNMRQEYVLAEYKATTSWSALGRVLSAHPEHYQNWLLSSVNGNTPEMLCPVLSSPGWDRNEHSGTSSANKHEDNEGIRASVITKKDWENWHYLSWRTEG